jgi:DNA repair protein RadD
MSFILRQYQEDAVQAGINYFQSPEKGNALVVIPTGGGKSLCIAETIKRLGQPALIFQPSKEILEQNYQKYTSYGYSAGMYSASKNRKEIAGVTFATIGSVVNSPELFKHVKYIIGDEAHFFNPKGGMYDSFLKAIGNPKTLGFTATPYRLNTDGFGGSMLKFLTRTRPRIFDNLIYYVQNKTLFDQGYLTPITYYAIPGFDQNMLSWNTTGADHSDKSVDAYYQKINFPASILKVVTSLKSKRKNCLIFTRGVAEAHYVARYVPDVVVLSAKTPPKEREQIILKWYAGEIWGIVNVGIMTTGIDFPELECIVIARPTMSLTLWYQMLGRGIRIHPDKKDCWAVDMGDNIRFFGKVENLHINTEGNGKWYVETGGKKLTNVYYSKT